MPRIKSEKRKNRYGNSGSTFTHSPSSRPWFESSRDNIKIVMDSCFLECGNGIEVMQWEDSEGGKQTASDHSQKDAKSPETSRCSQRKKTSTTIAIIITALASALIIISVGGNKFFGQTETTNKSPNKYEMLPHTGLSGNASIVEPDETVVLYSNEYLDPGQFRYSPNRRFKVGISKYNGNMVLARVDSSMEAVIWSASIDHDSNSFSNFKPRCFMQSDGNLVLRDTHTKKSIWTTKTHGNYQAYFVLNNSGRIAVRSGDESRTILWMDGVPRDQYTGPSSEDILFPVRGVFYYPWYPSTWGINGHRPHYATSLGMYSSSDPVVADAHIDAMDYGNIKLSIASWWGPETNLDRARLTMLMDKTVAKDSSLKWTIYHEHERNNDPTPEEIRQDFDYLKKWFAWHKAWAQIDGRPLILVYNEGGCDVASRWVKASRGEWYIVLKLFSGFEDCLDQPDSWHQYGVGETDGIVHNPGYSFVISPGFWRADTDTPYLKRMDRTQFCQNAKKMVESGDSWQLIVSFNEAGEGTFIEPSPDWKSDSGYGDYLDCLQEIS